MPITIDAVRVFAEGLDHCECVAVHPDGSVWAGGEAGQIYRIPEAGGDPEEVAHTGGFILGIAFSPDASWLAICDAKMKCIWKLELNGMKLRKLSAAVEGKPLINPNYAVFDPAGRLYVSESGNFRQVNGKIYCFEAGQPARIWHPGPFSFANGMALSAQGDFLYLICTWLPGVERIAIGPDGQAGKREVYATLPATCPDGMAFDEEGNLYVSCYAPNAIYVISRRREVRLLIEDWEGHTLSNPTNIAFGGKDFKTLFTSNLGRWHISAIPMKTAGLPLASHRKGL